MLLGIIDILSACTPLLLIQWCTIIELGDTTRPTVYPSEPSETVKE